MSILKKEELIVLNKENFNRIKKNLSKHLNIPQSKISECLSKSMGFENFNHANNKGFKTDKFTNPCLSDKQQQNYSELEIIFQSQLDKKINAENVLLYHKPMLNIKTDEINMINNYIREIQSEVFVKQLNSMPFVFAHLVQCLDLELQHGIIFNLEKWFLKIEQLGFFKELYIGFYIKEFFVDILESFNKNNFIFQKQCFIKHLETLFLSPNKKLENILLEILFGFLDKEEAIIINIIKNLAKNKIIDRIERIAQFCFYDKHELSEIKLKILDIIQKNTNVDLISISKEVNAYNLVNCFFNSSLKTNDIIKKITLLSQFIDLLSVDKKMMVINLISEKISEDYSHFLLIDEIRLFLNK